MHKNNLNYFYQFSTICFVVLFFYISNTFLPIVNGQSVLTDQPNTEISTSTSKIQLLETSIFKTNDQSSILIKPTFNDNSTNIAFYMKCPSEACPNNGTIESPVYIFSAENLGHGTLPFSDYWAPPITSDYVAVEYKNDEQQFSCSGISLDNCLSDSHFISVFYFSLVENSTIITSEMLDEKKALNKQLQSSSSTDTSIASDALLQLSISLSSTSISSNLDNGLIVTATLDGVASIATSSISATDTPTSTETKTNVSTSAEVDENSSIGSFLMNIVDNVIEIFTSEETILDESSQTESVTESIPIEPTLAEPDQTQTVPTEPISELPTTETPEDESITENTVQSSISTDDLINNEVITTEF